MRSKTRHGLFSLVIMASLLVLGCGGGDSPVSPPTPPTSLYDLGDSTTVIAPDESIDIQAYDPGSGSVSLSESSSFAQETVVGDIIIGQNNETAPDGFLRKITSKTTSGGSIILQTVPATLPQAFENMALSDSLELRPSDIRSSKLLNGSTLNPDKDDKTFSVALNCILFDQDGDHDTTEDQVKMVGQYSFDAQLLAEIEIDWHVLTKFETSIKTEKEVSLQLLANLAWEFDYERQVELAEFRLGAIPIGGVVWMVPTISVEAHIHGDMTVTFETGITYTEVMTNGFGFANGSYYQVKSSSSNFTYTPPTFGTEFNFEAGASLNSSCLLYGVAGPYVAGKIGFQFQAVLNADPCSVKLDLGLDAILYAVAGIECDLLDLDYNQQYQLYTQDIGDWTFPLSDTGNVNINTAPDELSPAWSLTGPCNYSLAGNGDLVIPDLEVGDYSISWGHITGWITPENQTFTLYNQGLTTFNGNYIYEDGTGTINVNAEPDSAGASWTLTNEGGYHHIGEGDETINGLTPGEYTLNWRYVPDWLQPEGLSGTLTANSTLEFAGTYEPNPGYGNIAVDVDPDAIEAPWTLTGPESYLYSGQGDETVPGLLPGEYDLAWGQVEGWIAPGNETLTLNPYGTTSVSGTYTEETGLGTITINTEPDELNVSWILAGPNDVVVLGSGDETLTGMEEGFYSASWNTPEGYVSPPYGQGNLVAGETLALEAVFVGAASIVVDPNPDSLDIPWTISSTDGYTHSGHGDATLIELVPGQYTITWSGVPGWVSPPAKTEELTIFTPLNFSCTYSEESIPLLDLVTISPGSFTMGSEVNSDETPHEVTLTGSLQMSNTEVTNAQMVSALQYAYNYGYITSNHSYVYDALDGSTEVLLMLSGMTPVSKISFANGTFSTTAPNQPVINIKWYGAAAYCDWLSLQEGLTRAYNHGNWSCNSGDPYAAMGYRLPTEAEWEYSCRANTETHYYTGDCLDANTQANFGGDQPYGDCEESQDLNHIVDVSSYPANPWGLYDMHGNVREWCNDYFSPYSGDETNPVGGPSHFERVVRGGCYFEDGYKNRSANRFGLAVGQNINATGLRIVRSGG